MQGLKFQLCVRDCRRLPVSSGQLGTVEEGGGGNSPSLLKTQGEVRAEGKDVRKS